MLVFAFLISGSFSIGHLAAPFVDPITLNAIRFFIASFVMGGVGIIFYKKNPFIIQAPWRFIILGALTTIFFVTMFIALRITTPISTSAVFTLIPFMSAGFGWLFLRQTTAHVVLMSLVIAAIGAIWVIFRGDTQAVLEFNIGKGEIIFFTGCVAYAAYAPLAKKFSRGEPILHFTFMVLFATMLFLFVWGNSIIWQTNWFALPSIVWLAIGYLAVLATILTFFLLQFATLRLPASKVYSYGYLIPSIVIIYEGALGHGWASPIIFIGAFITAAALLIVAFAADY